MTQLFRWINSPPGQHCLAVIHTQYHSMCITLALYTSCITMWITHITPCTPLCDGRPLSFLEYIGVNQEQFTCQCNKEASPLSPIPCQRSFQNFLSSQRQRWIFLQLSRNIHLWPAAQRGKCFLQDHPIVAATLSHPDHFKQYSFYFTIDINVCKPRYRYKLF